MASFMNRPKSGETEDDLLKQQADFNARQKKVVLIFILTKIFQIRQFRNTKRWICPARWMRVFLKKFEIKNSSAILRLLSLFIFYVSAFRNDPQSPEKVGWIGGEGTGQTRPRNISKYSGKLFLYHFHLRTLKFRNRIRSRSKFWTQKRCRRALDSRWIWKIFRRNWTPFACSLFR